MTTISTKMMMAAGIVLTTLACTTDHAEARGFGRGGFGHHGGFRYHGGFRSRGFGDYGRFYRHGYRHRFGGLGFGYPSGIGILSAYDGGCRVVFSPALGGYARVCG
ncbi:hypothetical protein VQ02_07975 [Methylobacterium variabile]|jgi:hypothetical protein|uniref:Sulfur globule protein n=1 Tax=Methylobacterium variabile TaxID=298794 RepID=A0A0J6VMJ4_9HYPH|nr:hypothetical protein [Methylobacterium variabile]KMO40396.1 hypothetical protein VQ02_07975 [Methylobacterium variabile]